jgi:hypothetical protein
MIADATERDGWVGLSSAPETIASEPWLITALVQLERNGFSECLDYYARKELDIADIVRDQDFSIVITQLGNFTAFQGGNYAVELFSLFVSSHYVKPMEPAPNSFQSWVSKRNAGRVIPIPRSFRS